MMPIRSAATDQTLTTTVEEVRQLGPLTSLPFLKPDT
jgi:hypothetical protein